MSAPAPASLATLRLKVAGKKQARLVKVIQQPYAVHMAMDSIRKNNLWKTLKQNNSLQAR